MGWLQHPDDEDGKEKDMKWGFADTVPNRIHGKMRDKLAQAGLAYPLPSVVDVEKYYAGGVIRRSDLKDGVWYVGMCRNASCAVWDAEKGCFWYIRFKFDARFAESINHIADDNGFDLFVPMFEVNDGVVSV